MLQHTVDESRAFQRAAGDMAPDKAALPEGQSGIGAALQREVFKHDALDVLLLFAGGEEERFDVIAWG